MAMTRRQFLGRSGMAAGGILGAGFFGDVLTHPAHAQTIGDRYHINVLLDGGNDWLNTLVPVDDGGTGALRSNYEQARDSLRIPASDLIIPLGPSLVDANTGSQLGLHPALGGIASLYASGKVAILQNVGYPNPNLSHDTSRKIWQFSSRTLNEPTGWLGRHLESQYGLADIKCFSVGSDPREYFQTATNILSAGRVTSLAFPTDYRNSSDTSAKLGAMTALAQSAVARAEPGETEIAATLAATLLASQSYPALDAAYEAERPVFDGYYNALGTGFARDLHQVAMTIRAVEQGVENVSTRFFRVRNGGYDTHSEQGAGIPGGRHYDLHKEVGDAIELFFADLEVQDSTLAGRVTMNVYSEFSRRIKQNDSGTDHGSTGGVFVIGGNVNGGLYGNHADIHEDSLVGGNTVYSQDPANPHRSIDFRDIHGTLLLGHIGADPAAVAAILPAETGDQNEHWTAPDFELPFL